MATRGRRIRQRRELLILLPGSLLVLVALSTFALFAYRETVELLIDERRGEAARLARRLAGEITPGPLPGADKLRRRLPAAREVTVLDDQGQIVATTGIRGAALETSRPWWRLGPPVGEDLISGSARFQKNRRTCVVEVDLPAPILRSRQRGLAVLTPFVLVMNGAITVLVLVFLRNFLAPFEGLLQRARDAGQDVSGADDELVFLVETFEKALAALSEDRRAAPELREAEELRALESTLARSLASGVLLCDAGGNVLALNEVGAALLATEAPGGGPETDRRPLVEVLAHHPELASMLDRAVRRGREVKRRECAIETREGRWMLGLTAHPLRRADATVRGFLVLFADITETERETAEIRLADSLSQLGELTAGVAHELRNSLATLRDYLTPSAMEQGDAAGEGEAHADAPRPVGIEWVEELLRGLRRQPGAAVVDLDPASAGPDPGPHRAGVGLGLDRVGEQVAQRTLQELGDLQGPGNRRSVARGEPARRRRSQRPPRPEPAER